MYLVRCTLGKSLVVVCHCFPPGLEVPTFVTRCPHARHDARDPSGGRWNLWARILSGNFCLNVDFHTTFRDLLHAANLRHGTDGFTSPPKEGVLRIFSPLKIRRLRPGLNPRTWVPKASTLPLDHRSRLFIFMVYKFPNIIERCRPSKLPRLFICWHFVQYQASVEV